MNLPGVAGLPGAPRAARGGDAPRGAGEASAPFVLPQPSASGTQGVDTRAAQAPSAREARNERGPTRGAREPAQDRVAQRREAASGAGRLAGENPHPSASQPRTAEATGERDERRDAAVDDTREPEAVSAAEAGPNADVANLRADDAPTQAADAAARGEALPGAAPGASPPDAELPARMLALLGVTPGAPRDAGTSLASAMPDASPGSVRGASAGLVLRSPTSNPLGATDLLTAAPAASVGPGGAPVGPLPGHPAPSAAPTLASPPIAPGSLMGALPDMAAPSADLGAASTLTAALPASPVPESAALRDGGNPSAALAALVAQGGDEAMRAERADLPPPLDPLATPTDAPAALPGAARATSDVAAARLQFTAPVVLPARPEVGMDEAFDQRIVWMAEQRIGRAEMRVSPEGAGPIDVRLQIDGHRVTAQFSAANADVRQALEAGMDRLRDLLGQRGMELADAQVGQQHSRPGQGGAPAAHGAVDMADDAQPTVTTLRALRARGLVDEYV